MLIKLNMWTFISFTMFNLIITFKFFFASLIIYEEIVMEKYASKSGSELIPLSGVVRTPRRNPSLSDSSFNFGIYNANYTDRIQGKVRC